MAVNETRSMNADLRQGVADGIVKSIRINRGGPDMASTMDRYTLTEQFGKHYAELPAIADWEARRLTDSDTY